MAIRIGKGNFTRWLSPDEWLAPAEEAPKKKPERVPADPGSRERAAVAASGSRYVDPLEIAPVDPLDFRMVDGQWVHDPGWWKRPG